MAFSHYIYSGTKRLRCGYTTGTCAALAAQAACRALLSTTPPKTARLTTPKGIDVEVAIQDARRGEDWAACSVRKDGGDDIDATHGLLVCATVRRTDDAGVHIIGGNGVGTVTKPGLEQPVGAAAINRVPREMIRAQVEQIAAFYNEPCAFEVAISVEGGEEAAARTFNPHLGIVGGISILGTSGIVEPMSLTALRESIELEISQKAAEGARSLIIVPGNYGRDFVDATPDLAAAAQQAPVVSCSNFIGAAIDAACRSEIERMLVVGHFGKMAKVAGGIMDTHSRTADCRTEIVCAHAATCGAQAETCRALLAAATTDACLAILDDAALTVPTLASIACALEERLSRRATPSMEIAAVVFTNERGELFRTASSARIIRAISSQNEHDTTHSPEGTLPSNTKGARPE